MEEIHKLVININFKRNSKRLQFTWSAGCCYITCNTSSSFRSTSFSSSFRRPRYCKEWYNVWCKPVLVSAGIKNWIVFEIWLSIKIISFPYHMQRLVRCCTSRLPSSIFLFQRIPVRNRQSLRLYKQFSAMSRRLYVSPKNAI